MMNPKFLSLLAGLTLLGACHQKPTSSTTPAADTQKKERGGVDSGGGYADKNSVALLQSVSSELNKKLAMASEAVFRDLPATWDSKRLQQVMEHIEQEPAAKRSRDGRALMFDFNVSQEKISALAPFFESYAHIPSSQQEGPELVEDLELRLLHESAHLWGLTEVAAEDFAKTLVDRMNRDMALCEVDALPVGPEQAPTAYLINISRRTAAHMMSIYYYDPNSDKPSDEFVVKVRNQGVKSEDYRYVARLDDTDGSDVHLRVPMSRLEDGTIVAQVGPDAKFEMRRSGTSTYVLGETTGMRSEYEARCSFNFDR